MSELLLVPTLISTKSPNLKERLPSSLISHCTIGSRLHSHISLHFHSIFLCLKSSLRTAFAQRTQHGNARGSLKNQLKGLGEWEVFALPYFTEKGAHGTLSLNFQGNCRKREETEKVPGICMILAAAVTNEPSSLSSEFGRRFH